MKNSYFIFFLFLSLILSCTESKKEIIFKKNACYSAKLEQLKKDTLYVSVQNQFADSFPNLRRKEKILQFTQNKIDEAVFFNKDRNKCILIILQRHAGSEIFGYGRAVEGIKGSEGWQFSLSREYILENDYLELFNDNSFDNISKIARYCILIDGKNKRSGCEIDDYYWFEYGVK